MNSTRHVFVKKYQEDFFIFLLYVDAMLVVGHDASNIVELKKALTKSFAIKNINLALQNIKILGMRIVRDKMKNMLWFRSFIPVFSL